ncbi:hypothetical protein FRC03_006732 [Tulasnella sp. 419]|nr:hypothetical protein FRC03_006732 [Tulasnella sp. 419]
MNGDVPASPAQLHDDVLDELQEDAGVFFTRDVLPEEEYYIRRLSRTEHLHKTNRKDRTLEMTLSASDSSYREDDSSASISPQSTQRTSISQVYTVNDGRVLEESTSHIMPAPLISDPGLVPRTISDGHNGSLPSPHHSMNSNVETACEVLQPSSMASTGSHDIACDANPTELGTSHDLFDIPFQSLLDQNLVPDESISASDVDTSTSTNAIPISTPSTPDISHHVAPPSPSTNTAHLPQTLPHTDVLTNAPVTSPNTRVDGTTPERGSIGHLLFSPVTPALFTPRSHPASNHPAKRKSSTSLQSDGVEAAGDSQMAGLSEESGERLAKRAKIQSSQQQALPSTPGLVRSTLISADKTEIRAPSSSRRRTSSIEGHRELRSVSPDTDALLDSISMVVDRTVKLPKQAVFPQKPVPTTPRSIIKSSPWRLTASTTAKKAVTFGSPVRPRIVASAQVKTPQLKAPTQSKTPQRRVLPLPDRSSTSLVPPPTSSSMARSALAVLPEYRFVFTTSESASPLPVDEPEIPPPPLQGGFKFEASRIASPARPNSKPIPLTRVFNSSINTSVRANIGSPVRPTALARPQDIGSPLHTVAAKPRPVSPLKDHNPRVLSSSSTKVSLLKPPLSAIPVAKLESKLPRPAALPKFGYTAMAPSVMMVHVPTAPSIEMNNRQTSPKRRLIPQPSAQPPPVMKFRPVIPGTLSGWEGKAKKSSQATNENDPAGKSGSHGASGSSTRNTGREENPLVESSDNSHSELDDGTLSTSKTPIHSIEALDIENLGSIRDPDSPRRSRRLSKEKAKDTDENHDMDAPITSSSKRTSRQPSESHASTSGMSSNREVLPQKAPKPPVHPLDWAKTEKEIRALTTKNTARNQAYFNELHRKVVKVDAPRPPSPTSRIRTIADKAQEEEANARSERVKRRGVKRGVDQLDANEGLEEEDQKHARGAGDDEDYQTPKRMRLDEDLARDGEAQIPRLDLGGSSSRGKGIGNMKSRSGSSTSSSSSLSAALSGENERLVKPNSKGRFVKWDKKLIFKCGEESRKEPAVDPRKSCLSKSSATTKLDDRGNVPDANKTPEDIRKDKIVVVKYVYADDADVDEPQPAEPADTIATRKAKRKKI